MSVFSRPLDDVLIPRCRHGHIILGCPHRRCPEQDAYVADINARVEEWHVYGEKVARRHVRSTLGLPAESED